ncbi:lipoprotein [Paenibacillus sp. MZ04-78.2]|uniref:lipoprotein n=1 Tax=Paenibacillus sp. MZ04-78.2 TaxID=2962034 RepID=UPI0020B881AE|nr:lipoprotein [Paenibacillus sp. MZ04-78.2]MCP3776071.1 lipoprotein [Paenibacillus sp. MZ04-78.2]
MKRINLVLVAFLAVALLAGCAKTDQPAAAPTGNTEKTAVAEEKDVSQNANVLKEKKFDQLTKDEWDKIRLSKN